MPSFSLSLFLRISPHGIEQDSIEFEAVFNGGLRQWRFSDALGHACENFECCQGYDMKVTREAVRNDVEDSGEILSVDSGVGIDDEVG